MINDQSFLKLLEQSEWCVDSVVDEAALDDMHEDEPAYPEFLESIITDINIELVYYKIAINFKKTAIVT